MTDPSINQVLELVLPALQATGIDYVLTGSVASSIHGEPFASLDVDLVVKMTPDQARRLAGELPARIYRDVDSLVDASNTSGMANLIDMSTGLKVDLSVMPAGAWRDEIFRRRVSMKIAAGDRPILIVSPEDIILMKLDWRRETHSVKQWNNALGVARAFGPRLDWDYLRRQAALLGVHDDLNKLRSESGF